MKNKRMLSIGKFNFSPSLEQTPKARSSKNNFNFSMVGAKGLKTNVLKNSEYIDTIPGIEFKKAFFGIFLSNNPIKEFLNRVSFLIVLVNSKARKFYTFIGSWVTFINNVL